MWHWSVNTLFWQLLFDHNMDMQYHVAGPTLARKCDFTLVSLWFRRTVTWLPRFLGWIDNQIFLVLGLRFNFIWGESYQRVLHRGWSIVFARYRITFPSTHNLTSFWETEQFSVVHRKYLSSHCISRIAHILVISITDEQLRHWFRFFQQQQLFLLCPLRMALLNFVEGKYIIFQKALNSYHATKSTTRYGLQAQNFLRKVPENQKQTLSR